MNKAFTRETETEEALPEFVDALPPGMKNYMTPEGVARLKDEFRRLRDVERLKLIASKEDAPVKKRLREIDQRIQYIAQRLQITEIVDPRRQKNSDEIYFGASVTYVDGAGGEHIVRIVGIDEARQELGEVSWVSPIARALNGAGEGEVVKFLNPSGIQEIKILKIEYP
ncbi:MAG: GreA/GreB family elongation factor [Alphaproteobacteria bacterium]